MSRGLLHAAADRFAAHPVVYNGLQRIFGQRKNAARVAAALADCDGKVVLDVGAGTGLYRGAVPPGAHYIWLDEDPIKLAGFRARGLSGAALLGNAVNMGIADASVDVTLCSGLSHHIADNEVGALFAELARVTRQKLVFLDAVADPESIVSKTLWSADRGSFPREAAGLLELLGDHFVIESLARFKPAHTFVLCVCRPKPR